MPIHSSFLRYFDEVRKCGSIRRAAAKLHVASSAVNRQILKIEAELGTKLFLRSASGMKLTAAGELLAGHIDKTLAEAERTLGRIRNLEQDATRRITIAGQESVIARFLPPALLALHADFPDVSTSFKAASGAQLNDLLLTGTVDIAIAFDPEPVDEVQQIACRQLPVGAIMTPAHPLAAQPQAALAECAEYSVILPDRSWPLRSLLDREIRKTGLKPKVITSSNSVEFLRAMLDQELGIGFQTIVGIETEVEKGALVHVPLHNPDPITQTLALCTRSDAPDWAPLIVISRLLSDRLEHYTRGDA